MKKPLSIAAFLLILSVLSAQNPDFMSGWEIPDIAVFGEPCLQKFLDAGAVKKSWTTKGSVEVITSADLDARKFGFFDDGSLFYVLVGDGYCDSRISQEDWDSRRLERGTRKPLPPRFTARGVSWESTYDEWAEALRSDPEFDLSSISRPLVLWGYVYSDASRKTALPHFTARLEYVWKKDPRYTLRAVFDGGYGTSRDSRGTLVNICVTRYALPQKALSGDDSAERKLKALAPDDAFAFACSASLVSINGGSHTDFSGFSNTASNRTKYAGILRDSWDITTSAQLIDTVRDLSVNGQSGSYRALAKLIADNPGLTMPELIEKESLGTLDALRLFYVNGTIGRTGAHGIEAWDLGRCITILRWSAGTGLITEDTARSEIQPLVERIKKSYVSWEDYMTHYIMGRGFFGLTGSESLLLVSNALKDITDDARHISFDLLRFEGSDDNRAALSFDDAFYVPGGQEWPWLLAQYSKTCRDSRYSDEREIAQDLLDTAHSLIPNDLGTINAECGIYLSSGEHDKLLGLIDSSEQYARGKSVEKEEVLNFTLYTLVACVVTGQGERAIQTFDSLPESARSNPSVQYFSGFAYIQLHDSQSDVERRKVLFARAGECFRAAGLAGMEIPESVTNWLEANQTE